MEKGLLMTGMLAGGLGLFLLAVSMITEGLTHAAGTSLRDMLSKSTRTPGRGILAGLMITAIVQSSSAVTVATIGFVNAGLISMYQALGVVFGSNIGTTMTGWLVALLGFKIKVEAFALPMIGVGMLLRLTGRGGRRAHIGMALAGFGLFFIGIDVLKEAFDGLATSIDLEKFTLDGIAGVFLYLGIGFLITLFTQSSSAAIAITLTAATGGVVGLYAAAAMVIGANVGTTSTAALAVIGATSNAKRVAAAHIIFNLVTGGVALAILPGLFWVVGVTGEMLGLADIPAVTLALFHTTFNILGVLLMWPLSKRLTKFLEKRFVTQEEVEGRPRYLDKTIAVSPVLAVNALALELSRIAAVARRMALDALSSESDSDQDMVRDNEIVNKLSRAMADFIARLETGSLSEEVATQLARILRAEQHLQASADHALEVVRAQGGLGKVADDTLQEALTHFRTRVVGVLKMTDPQREDFSMAACDEQVQYMEVAYEDTKHLLLQFAAGLRLPVPQMNELMEQHGRIRRMARQMYKATQYLAELYTVAGVRSPDNAQPEKAAAEAAA